MDVVGKACQAYDQTNIISRISPLVEVEMAYYFLKLSITILTDCSHTDFETVTKGYLWKIFFCSEDETSTSLLTVKVSDIWTKYKTGMIELYTSVMVAEGSCDLGFVHCFKYGI